MRWTADRRYPRPPRKTLDDLRKSAKKKEPGLTGRFTADPRNPVPPPGIDWRSAGTGDPDIWLRANQLDGGATAIAVRVADDHEERAARLVQDLADAWTALDEAESELDHPELAPVLDQLQHLLDHTALDGARCPICGQQTAWRESAAAVLGRVQGRRRHVQAVRAAVSALTSWVGQELAPLLDAGVDGAPDGAVGAFRSEVGRDGDRPRPALRQVTVQLGSALAAPAHSAWLRRLRKASDATAEWTAARRDLVAPLVAHWRDHGEVAAAAGDWATAAKTLAELQTRERQRRQDGLTERLRDAVNRLLPDAAIVIQDITHKGGAKRNWGVGLQLTIGDRPATLGMLSSGQRNALLLASLLCIGPPAPFGFVVADDPVHALDDLRVDLLAQELTELAAHRQVIVLTHDARLEEHLRVRNHEMQLQLLRRDASTATVGRELVTSPWDELLQQASTVVAVSVKDCWNLAVPVPHVVGGLCRNAIDGVVRHAVIAHAHRRESSAADALKALDKAGKSTWARFQHLQSLAGGAGEFTVTQRCLDDHLRRWDEATHAGAGVPTDLAAEIKAARQACKEMVGWTG